MANSRILSFDYESADNGLGSSVKGSAPSWYGTGKHTETEWINNDCKIPAIWLLIPEAVRQQGDIVVQERPVSVQLSSDQS